MAKYIKQEMPDVHNTGENKVYYRLQRTQHFTHEQFVDYICRTHPSSKGSVISALVQMADNLAELLGHGNTVTIDGIGTFQATIGMKRDKEVDSFEEGEPARNAQSLCVTGVNYRTDKMLVRKTNRYCKLERGGTYRIRRITSTKEERLQMALDYLTKHGMMRIADYVKITGLSRTAASLELREFRSNPESGITFHGRGTQKVYVKRAE